MKEVSIKIDQIYKRYSSIDVLKNISFDVKKNRIHGFLGPNGAGKSTTMKIISGILQATSGEVTVFDQKKIGYLPEIPPLYLGQLVGQYLKFVQDIYLPKGTSKSVRKELYKKALIRTGLKDVEKRLIKNLSKGFKQRVGIAATIIYNPEILIFDEPTVGLDPKSIIEIRELILELKIDHTILLSTHQLHEASLLCDDLTIINHGEIISSGTVDEISKEFFTYRLYMAEVDSCSDDLITFIKSKSEVKNLIVEKSELGSRLTIESIRTDTNEDLRPFIGRAIIENGHTLYGLQEKTPDLEDIFKKATGEVL